MQPSVSATTGAGQEPSGQTGPASGSIRSNGQLTVSETEQRAWLVARPPAEVDAALRQSLISSLMINLEPVREWRFPSDAKPYQILSRCLVSGPQENRAAALHRLEAATISATPQQMKEWVAGLHAVTAGSQKSEVSLRVVLGIYVSTLAKYPADVAYAACTQAMTTMKWFPTLAELIEICDRLALERRSMIAALRASL